MFSPLPRSGHEITEISERLSTICGIIVHHFLTPAERAEAERRFRLATIGVLEEFRDGHSHSS